MDTALSGLIAYAIILAVVATFGVLFGSNIIVLRRDTANIGVQLQQLQQQAAVLEARVDIVLQGRKNDGGDHPA